MEKKQADKIKKVLRKENAVCVNNIAGYYDGNELRVKVAEFIIRSNFEGANFAPHTAEQKEKETRGNIIKVLRALERNGLRPEYRTEQRETSNCFGTFDSRYVIFK